MLGVVSGQEIVFGAGGGIIAVPAMVLFLEADEHKAHATAIAIILPLTLVSAFFYVSSNYVDWNITLKVVVGGTLGGYIGARLLNICPPNVLRKIFAVFIIAAAVRMLG